MSRIPAPSSTLGPLSNNQDEGVWVSPILESGSLFYFWSTDSWRRVQGNETSTVEEVEERDFVLFISVTLLKKCFDLSMVNFL